MRHCKATTGTRLRRAWLLPWLAAACSATSQAAPPMAGPSQATAHWIHYMQINANLQHADVPWAVGDSEQLRWWMFDGARRWTLQGPPPPGDAAAAAPMQPLLVASPAGDRGCD